MLTVSCLYTYTVWCTVVEIWPLVNSALRQRGEGVVAQGSPAVIPREEGCGLVGSNVERVLHVARLLLVQLPLVSLLRPVAKLQFFKVTLVTS